VLLDVVHSTFYTNEDALWDFKGSELHSECEYFAATHGIKEALWLRGLLSEIFGAIPEATTMFSDNQAAIYLTRDHQYHVYTKRTDVRYHWIRWVIEQKCLYTMRPLVRFPQDVALRTRSLGLREKPTGNLTHLLERFEMIVLGGSSQPWR